MTLLDPLVPFWPLSKKATPFINLAQRLITASNTKGQKGSEKVLKGNLNTNDPFEPFSPLLDLIKKGKAFYKSRAEVDICVWYQRAEKALKGPKR